MIKKILGGILLLIVGGIIYRMAAEALGAKEAVLAIGSAIGIAALIIFGTALLAGGDDDKH
jgi:hypothetical protein